MMIVYSKINDKDKIAIKEHSLDLEKPLKPLDSNENLMYFSRQKSSNCEDELMGRQTALAPEAISHGLLSSSSVP